MTRTQMRWRCRMVLVVGLVAFTPAAARAFSLGNHKSLTQQAMNQIAACVSEHGAALPAEALKPSSEAARRFGPDLMVRCNRHQDCVVRKAVLWHFYPQSGHTLDPAAQDIRICPVETNFNGWLATLEKEIGAAEDPAHVYALLGAILHYVQDVAVPSHVVPVMHPSRHGLGDKFDGSRAVVPLKRDSKFCEGLLSERRSFGEIVRDTAQKTRDALKAELPKELLPADATGLPTTTWALFWDPQIQADGFGRYGCVDNNFGDTRLKCAGLSWTVAKTAYDDFTVERHRDAIEASAAAIVTVLRRVPFPEDTGSGFICPLPLKCGDRLCGGPRAEWRESACWPQLKPVGQSASTTQTAAEDETAACGDKPDIASDEDSCGSCGCHMGRAGGAVAGTLSLLTLVGLAVRRTRRRRL
jgi:hypothetical protein